MTDVRSKDAPTAGARAEGTERRRVVVTGVVQGVGFRPFVYRLASELGLGGFVGNDSTSVFVEVEGRSSALETFVARMEHEAPPLALVESVTWAARAPIGDQGFRIVASEATPGARTLVPPDVVVCHECMAEVLDPADRRYRYPFANCTDCGPRFTIICDLPYDRPATTMARFAMCPACRAEYEDPTDRRYHAQPIACPACGPHISWQAGDARVEGTDAVLEAAHEALATGLVVAVKGLGGYHLACDATNEAAVHRLRARKQRSDKPFAVMVPDLDGARSLALIDDAEAEALTSAARPIVLVRRRPGRDVCEQVAPQSPWLGLMLPYTPLHHLLLQAVPGSDQPPPRAVVLTSGNLADEPICFDDDDARQRLSDLADAFLTHDRPIHFPCDDSVVRLIDGVVQPVRRSRGYAPLPVALPVDVRPTVAAGGELKNTCCVAAGRHAWVSQHLGDMENLETLAAFEQAVGALTAMYGVTPEVVAADAHPGYLTRRWAVSSPWPVVDVQHHHAHVAAVMAEHGLDGTAPVLGFAFDGTGHGVDAGGRPQIWGGEVLLADYDGYERLGHLRPLPLPGGDAAVRNPCRIAVAYLAALGIEAGLWLPSVAECEGVELSVVRRQVERDVGCVPTTSMGRLFDAVASMLGVRHRIDYEAQAAIELEVVAERAAQDGESPLRFVVGDDGVIDPEPLLRGLVARVRRGDDGGVLAHELHTAVAHAVLASASALRARRGPVTVALTGGVFQNALLTRLTRSALQDEGFEVLTHRVVPPNDGGLALGQAVIAGRRR
ncbi:MAG TPA: carbamoyltransferase HypF [Acidimicrobiales bacterium]